MTHYTEEDLILYYYRERDDIEAIDKHLATCAECRKLHSGLEQLLGAVDEKPVPERGPAYSSEVWQRLEPKLGRSRVLVWRQWFSWPRLALAASVAVLVLVAFVSGLERGREVGFEGLSAEAREKMLMVAVGQHLERSGRMLVSLVNTDPAVGLDLQFQRDQARRLASANRVYRASAGQSGHLEMVDLLEQLERVLTEIANSPQTLSAPEYLELWRRIEGSALLVKMKLLESETRQRSMVPAPRRNSNET
jgi:hypothetical protein